MRPGERKDLTRSVFGLLHTRRPKRPIELAHQLSRSERDVHACLQSLFKQRKVARVGRGNYVKSPAEKPFLLPLVRETRKERTTRKRVFKAIADTLEGLGVGEIMSLVGPEPVDRDSIKAAFDAVVRELRKRGAR